MPKAPCCCLRRIANSSKPITRTGTLIGTAGIDIRQKSNLFRNEKNLAHLCSRRNEDAGTPCQPRIRRTGLTPSPRPPPWLRPGSAAGKGWQSRPGRSRAMARSFAYGTPLSQLPDGFGNRILEFAGIVLADLPASTNFICHRKPPLSKAKLLLRVPRPGNGRQCHAPAPYQSTLNLLK